ncbi:hypothetical protein FPV67DRAFT_1495705 [Lyophyllum atratum]|nr:hypothetical protein FPV67DRAFT_1495705 [Lyophyllum atratum]
MEASAFSSVTVREAAYGRIRQGIAASEAATRASKAATISWKRRYNELSLISRLPPELLATIFMCTIGWSELDRSRVPWFCVSHVCSHWRRVALETPSLWSDIPLNCPRWAKEMMARSKMSPLTITVMCGYYTRRSTAAVRAALSQLSRIRKLSLYESHGAPRPFSDFAKFLDSPAPLLETLEICITSARGKASAEYTLPEELFSGVSPRLARLGIRDCGLNWGAPIFANLVSLKVANYLPNTSRPLVNQFFSALSTMSRLEKLDFDSDFASASGELISPAATANLPRLVQLSVRSRLVNCVSLMDHITYPSSAHVTVECHLSDGSATSFSLVRRLADTLGRRIGGPVRCVSFDSDRIRAWTSSGINPRLDSEIPQFDFCFTLHEMPNFGRPEIATEVFQLLPLEFVESLTVVDLDLSKTAWVNLFGGLTQLKEVEVGHYQSGFLGAFSSGTSDPHEPCDQASEVQFKALKKLTIRFWTLDETINPGGAGKTLIQSLFDCLEARREQGTAPGELVLAQCCHVAEEDLVALKEIVTEVQVELDSEDSISSDSEDSVSSDSEDSVSSDSEDSVEAESVWDGSGDFTQSDLEDSE